MTVLYPNLCLIIITRCVEKVFNCSTLRDISYNARWFWTTIRYGPMTTAYLCWTTGNGFKMTDLGF